MLNNAYCKRVYDQILARDPDQKEFHQAVYEVLEGLSPWWSVIPSWRPTAFWSAL